LVRAILATASHEANLRRQTAHTLFHLADVVGRSIHRAAIEPLVFGDKPWEVDRQEAEEGLARAGSEEEHVRLGPYRSRVARCDEQRSQVGFVVGQVRQHRHHEEPRRDPGRRQLPHSSEPEIGPGRPGLQSPGHRRIDRGDRKVHRHVRGRRDLSQEARVTRDERRLGRDGELQPGDLAGGLENSPGHCEPCLGGLVRVGGRAEGDEPPGSPRSTKLANEAGTIGFLHVDPPLEGAGLAHAEEFVRVTREAVVAAQFAAPIGIHRPAKRHGPGVQAVHELFRSKLVIFDAPSFVDRVAETRGHPRRRNTGLNRPISTALHVLSISGHNKTRGPTDPRVSSLPAPASAAARSATRPRATIASWPAGAGSLRLGSRLIYHQIPISEEPPIQHLDRFAGLVLCSHLDEPESARPSRELVRDDPNRLHGSGLLKELAQVLLRGLEGEVSDEQLCGHRATS